MQLRQEGKGAQSQISGAGVITKTHARGTPLRDKI